MGNVGIIEVEKGLIQCSVDDRIAAVITWKFMHVIWEHSVKCFLTFSIFRETLGFGMEIIFEEFCCIEWYIELHCVCRVSENAIVTHRFALNRMFSGNTLAWAGIRTRTFQIFHMHSYTAQHWPPIFMNEIECNRFDVYEWVLRK